MSIIKPLLLQLAIAVGVAGCATSTFTYGRDFNSANVGQIVKGKTTAAELAQLLGEPFQKTTINPTEEDWLYTYNSSEAHAMSLIVVSNVQTTGTQKSLNVVLDNGVVSSFTYNAGTGPQGSGTTTVP